MSRFSFSKTWQLCNVSRPTRRSHFTVIINYYYYYVLYEHFMIIFFLFLECIDYSLVNLLSRLCILNIHS